MFDEQIKTRRIVDNKILKAMLKEERHLFVPDEYISLALNDFR